MSATIKRARMQQAADGRPLATVVFTPQVPNPAAQADVEVVFEVLKCQAAHLDGEPYAVVGPLSCTLTDTREPYTLSQPQRKAVIDAALVAAAEFTEW